MSALDLETERMKITDLQNKIKALNDDKQRIELWVKSKQDQIDAFEEKAKKTREDLIVLDTRVQKEKKSLEKEQSELKSEKLVVKGLLDSANALNADADKKMAEVNNKLVALSAREKEIEIMDFRAQEKLNRWTSLSSQFNAIK